MDQKPLVTVIPKGQISVLDIKGDVTSFAEEPISKAYQQVTKNDSRKILLKFNQSNYINSAGIAIIISMVSDAQKAKQKIGVSGLSNHFRKIFDMIGLVDYVEIYDSEEEALAKL
ncbi:MAG TPA: anti-sigma factor antagonist [Bacteroidetes bacterium]|nr:anti-sigma factor antagonist [Bacteroidota bacterium]